MKHVYIVCALLLVPSLACADSGQLKVSPRTVTARISSSLPAEILTRGHYQVIVNEVSLLTAPRANADIQLTLRKGDRLNLMGVQNDVWAKVKLESGRIGYMYASSIQSLSSLQDQQKEQADLLRRISIRQQARKQARLRRVQAPTPTTLSDTSSSIGQTTEPTLMGNIYTVSGPKLNLRMDARPTSFLIRSLHKGDKVSVLQWLKNGWAHVKIIDGTQGYVFGRFLAK